MNLRSASSVAAAEIGFRGPVSVSTTEPPAPRRISYHLDVPVWRIEEGHYRLVDGPALRGSIAGSLRNARAAVGKERRITVMRLQGRAALITGAGSGIGRATAELFASEGAGVAILDRDAPAAEAAASAISATDAEAHPVVADVSSPDEMSRAVARSARLLGRLDIVFNNAGVAPSGSVLDTDEDEWDRCFAVNVKGVYLTSRAAIPHLLTAGGGSIINQASVAALAGMANFSAYSAAKGAVVSLTRAMAIDLAPVGIRVNALCPGAVHTAVMEPLMRNQGDGSLERGLELTAAKHPIGRLGTPMEIAAAALFLASDDAAFVTGAILPVDGGRTAQ